MYHIIYYIELCGDIVELNFKQINFIENELKKVNKCFKELSKLTKSVRNTGKLHNKDVDNILQNYDLLSKKNELLDFAKAMRFTRIITSKKGNTYTYIDNHLDSYFDSKFYSALSNELEDTKDSIDLDNLDKSSPLQSFIDIFKDDIKDIEVKNKENKKKSVRELLDDPQYEDVKNAYEEGVKKGKELYQLIIEPNDENNPKSIRKRVETKANEIENSKNYKEISDILDEILETTKDELENSYKNGDIRKKLNEIYSLIVTYPENLYNKTGDENYQLFSKTLKDVYDNYEENVLKSIEEEFKTLDGYLENEIYSIHAKYGMSKPLRDSSLSEDEIKKSYVEKLPKGITCEQVLLKNDSESTTLICSCKLKEEKELDTLKNIIVSKLREKDVFRNAIIDNLKYLTSGKGYVLYEFKIIIPTTLKDCAKLLKYSGISSEEVNKDGLECYKSYYSTMDENALKMAIERDLRDIKTVREVKIDNIEISSVNNYNLLTFDLLKRD